MLPYGACLVEAAHPHAADAPTKHPSPPGEVQVRKRCERRRPGLELGDGTQAKTEVTAAIAAVMPKLRPVLRLFTKVPPFHSDSFAFARAAKERPTLQTLLPIEKVSAMPTPQAALSGGVRQQMAELVRAGRGVSGLAREFGCNASSIHAWVWAAGGLDGSGTTSIDAPLSMSERQ